jgi:hypothetical protein
VRAYDCASALSCAFDDDDGLMMLMMCLLAMLTVICVELLRATMLTMIGGFIGALGIRRDCVPQRFTVDG